MTDKTASEKPAAQEKPSTTPPAADKPKADALETFKSEFASNLKRFITSTKRSMQYARLCSEMALRHFEEHGNLTYAQEFLEAMPDNYVRKAAYVKWLMAHAPISIEGKKLRKDKDDGAVEFRIDAACAKPFWEFAPDPENIMFEAADVVTALKQVLRKFRGDRYHAESPEAKSILAEADEAVRKIGKHAKVDQTAAA